MESKGQNDCRGRVKTCVDTGGMHYTVHYFYVLIDQLKFDTREHRIAYSMKISRGLNFTISRIILKSRSRNRFTCSLTHTWSTLDQSRRLIIVDSPVFHSQRRR